MYPPFSKTMALSPSDGNLMSYSVKSVSFFVCFVPML